MWQAQSHVLDLSSGILSTNAQIGQAFKMGLLPELLRVEKEVRVCRRLRPNNGQFGVRRDKTFMNASRSPLVTKTMAALCFDWYEKMAHDQLAADARTLPDWWHRPRG